MGCLKIAGAIFLLMAVGFSYVWYRFDEIPDIPELPDIYWGPGTTKLDDPAIKPFKVHVSDSALEDFMRRLNNTRQFQPPLEGIGFQYGVNSDFMNDLIAFWKTEYKWRERETFLNQFPQFQTQISGLNIHYIHAKPDKTKIGPGITVVPLLLLHGWPGSVREFYDILPMLTTPRSDKNFVFEVIAPSLPGYGFSEGASKPGLGYAQIGLIMKKLMSRLKFEKFYVQGGDWGSAVGSAMAIFYPDSVMAYHSNFCMVRSTKSKLKLLLGTFLPSLFAEEGHEEHLSQQLSFMVEETGYMHLQATKPDTVGIALTDSPAGLAAYILEKFSTGTNALWRNEENGGLNHYKRADLLDNIMIYWFSNSITTSMRLYSESLCRKFMSLSLDKIPINVPTACARFPKEFIYIPKSLLESEYPKLIRITDMPKGGHFAAFEVPDLLAEDVWQFVSTTRTKSPTKK